MVTALVLGWLVACAVALVIVVPLLRASSRADSASRRDLRRLLGDS